MVRFINYKGDKLPVRVSYYALKMLKAELGKSLSSMTEDDYEAYEILLYYSLQQGFKLTNKLFSFTKEEMVDILDESFFEFMKIIPEFFSEAQNDLPQEKILSRKEAKDTVAKK